MPNETPVLILDMYDGFSIIIGENSWTFNQDDTRERLLDVFDELNIEAKYEEVY